MNFYKRAARLTTPLAMENVQRKRLQDRARRPNDDAQRGFVEVRQHRHERTSRRCHDELLARRSKRAQAAAFAGAGFLALLAHGLLGRPGVIGTTGARRLGCDFDLSFHPPRATGGRDERTGRQRQRHDPRADPRQHCPQSAHTAMLRPLCHGSSKLRGHPGDKERACDS